LPDIRSIDGWCNPTVDRADTLVCPNLAEALAAVETPDRLPLPTPSQYYQLFVDMQTIEPPHAHPQLKLLGYDLSDATWTSSLFNCGLWEGALAPLVQRTNQYGLLRLEDAQTAQAILPDVWPNCPHAFVTIWAVFEVQMVE
jgi:hypothetical protein